MGAMSRSWPRWPLRLCASGALLVLLRVVGLPAAAAEDASTHWYAGTLADSCGTALAAGAYDVKLEVVTGPGSTTRFCGVEAASTVTVSVGGTFRVPLPAGCAGAISAASGATIRIQVRDGATWTTSEAPVAVVGMPAGGDSDLQLTVSSQAPAVTAEANRTIVVETTDAAPTGLVTVNLPATCALGDRVVAVGALKAGWGFKVVPPSGKRITDGLLRHYATFDAPLPTSTVVVLCGRVGSWRVGGRSGAPEARVVDRWGDRWYEGPRAASSWSVARDGCATAGGRLPTVSELYRVSGAKHGDLQGQAGAETVLDGSSGLETSGELWSATTWGVTEMSKRGIVSLASGRVASLEASQSRRYLCLYPNDATGVFESGCYGPPGQCWTAVGEGGLMRMDLENRPPLTWLAAQTECNRSHAHLARIRDYDENVPAGLPTTTSTWTNSSEWVQTADLLGLHGFASGVVRWGRPDQAYNAVPYINPASFVCGDGCPANANAAQGHLKKDVSTRRPFRCKGARYGAVANTASVPVALGAPYPASKTTGIVSHSTHRTSAQVQQHISSCFSLGGHLASTTDLFELIHGGVPGVGSAAWVLTADLWARSPFGQPFTLGWDTETSDPPAYTAGSQSSGCSNFSCGAYLGTYNDQGSPSSQPARCVWYPIDPVYAGPSTCIGGCFRHEVAGSQRVYWADSTDRLALSEVDPLAKQQYLAAVQDCADEGGHLPTWRELAALVRAGLPNGTGATVWTSDRVTLSNPADGSGGEYPLYGLIANWLGVTSDYAPTGSALSQTHTGDMLGDRSTGNLPYRCVWSNELK